MTEQEEFEFRLRLESESAGGSAPKAEPMAFGERFRMGLADPFQGGAQLLTNALPEGIVSAGNRLNNWLADKTGMVARLPEGGVQQQTMEREAAYQAARMAAAPHTLSSLITGEKSPEFDWARLLGNVASPANLAPGAAAVRATTLGGRMAAGAGVGAASSLLAPVAAEGDDYWAEKAKQAAIGATIGGAVPAAAAGFGRVISPNASKNPSLDLLKSEGVRPTIGQSVGGWGQRLEEKLQSWPIMGDAITAARERSVEQLNKAAINRATAPIGVKIDEVGQEGIKKAGDALSDAYDSVLSGLKVVKFDPQWTQDFGQLKTLARGLPSGVRGTFLNKTKTLIEDRMSVANGMTAQTMKQIDSELGTLARRYGRSSVASEQELGDAILQAQALLREQVGRNSPSAAARIKDINQGWANLVRVEGAGKAAINNEGVFTPAQLNNAIRTADSSVRKRGAARGTALMQDLGNAAQKQMGGRVANSGTVDRAAIGIGGLASYFIDPLIPIGLGLGAAAYSPPAQALLRGLTSARPAAAQPIANMLNKTSPMLSPAAGLLSLDLIE
jgi:hypothetical protein